MNKVMLLGRLTRDPEMTTVGDGIARAAFTVAVDRRQTDQNGNRVTDFIPCVAWRKTAEFIGKYFRRGQRIALEGSIEIRQYTAQDGSQRTFTDVNVLGAEFCESKGAPQDAAPAPQQEYREVEDDDLPF